MPGEHKDLGPKFYEDEFEYYVKMGMSLDMADSINVLKRWVLQNSSYIEKRIFFPRRCYLSGRILWPWDKTAMLIKHRKVDSWITRNPAKRPSKWVSCNEYLMWIIKGRD